MIVKFVVLVLLLHVASSFYVDKRSLDMYFASSAEEFALAKAKISYHFFAVESIGHEYFGKNLPLPNSRSELVIHPLHNLPHFSVMLDDARFYPSENNKERETIAERVRREGGTIEHEFNLGFSGALTRSAVEYLLDIVHVKLLVEADSWSQVRAQTGDFATCKPLGWHLQRISTRTANYAVDYPFDTVVQPNKRVRLYVIDDGVNGDHIEFCTAGGSTQGCTSRVLSSCSINFGSGPGVGPSCAGNNAAHFKLYYGGDSQTNHGTAVASAAAGNLAGVAKHADICAVRVAGDGGLASGAIAAAYQFVSSQVRAGNGAFNAIAVLSFGGAQAPTLQTRALLEMISGNHTGYNTPAAGVPAVAAAGNDNEDACLSFPSGNREAITVGATTRGDNLAAFSNWGSCVDIFAPGVGIISPIANSQTQYGAVDGTSFSGPVVAGALAVLWMENPTLTAQQATQLLYDTASCGQLSKTFTNNMKGSVNRFVYLGIEPNPSSSCGVPAVCNSAPCTAPAKPANAFCATPESIPLVSDAGSVAGTMLGKYQDYPFAKFACINGNFDVNGSVLTYAFTITSRDTYTIDACSASVSGLYMSLKGDCDEPMPVCNFGGCSAIGLSGPMIILELPIRSYILAIYSEKGLATDFVINIKKVNRTANLPACYSPSTHVATNCGSYSPVPFSVVNPTCASAIPFPMLLPNRGQVVVEFGAISTTTPVSTDLACGNSLAAGAVAAWYSLSNTGSSILTYSVTACFEATTSPVTVSVLGGTCGTLGLVSGGCGSFSVGCTNTAFKFNVQPNQSVFLRIASNGTTRTQAVVDIQPAVVVPSTAVLHVPSVLFTVLIIDVLFLLF